VPGLGFGVWGFGVGFGFRVSGFEFGDSGGWIRVSGTHIRVRMTCWCGPGRPRVLVGGLGFGIRDSGLGVRVVSYFVLRF
jgi:hypothetical protein